jgi:hypothetical protein
MILRRTLARRLLEIAALSTPIAGCSSGSGGNCSHFMPPPPQSVCVDPASLADAGIDTGGGCPTGSAAADAVAHALGVTATQVTVMSGPTQQGSLCCYEAQEIVYCLGRPYLVEGQPIVAPAQRGLLGWSDPAPEAPSVDTIDAEARAALAEAWTQDGMLEHASVASFGRFALELLAAGAPADLIEGAHRAALDEVRHARLCLGLASAYAGAPVGPSALPLGGQVEVTSDLASIAVRAAREGCIGETIAAVQAEEQHARATDPAVRAVLAIIAADEARHAELSWRTVAWAVRTGGDRVRVAVAEVLASVEGVVAEGARHEGALDACGRLDPEEQQRVAASVMVQVIRPAARLLVSAPRAEAERPALRA